jgi:hypothetical protein
MNKKKLVPISKKQQLVMVVCILEDTLISDMGMLCQIIMYLMEKHFISNNLKEQTMPAIKHIEKGGKYLVCARHHNKFITFFSLCEDVTNLTLNMALNIKVSITTNLLYNIFV